MRIPLLIVSATLLSGCSFITGLLDGLDRASQEPRFAFVEVGAIEGEKVLKVAALQPDDPAGVEPPKAFLFRNDLDAFKDGEGLFDLSLSPDGDRVAATYRDVSLDVTSSIRIYDIDRNARVAEFGMASDVSIIAGRCANNVTFFPDLPNGVPSDAVRVDVLLDSKGQMELIGWTSEDGIDIEITSAMSFVYDSPSAGRITHRVLGRTTFYIDYFVGRNSVTPGECRERRGSATLPSRPFVTLEPVGTTGINRIQRNGKNVVNSLRTSERIARNSVLQLGTQVDQ